MCRSDLVFCHVFLYSFLKNASALVKQHSTFLHEKCRAQSPLGTIAVWPGPCNPYRVTQSLSRACSTSCTSWGAGVQPVPCARGHGCGIPVLRLLSLIPSCWSCSPRRCQQGLSLLRSLPAASRSEQRRRLVLLLSVPLTQCHPALLSLTCLTCLPRA